jgi:hypothetical protein
VYESTAWSVVWAGRLCQDHLDEEEKRGRSELRSLGAFYSYAYEVQACPIRLVLLSRAI